MTGRFAFPKEAVLDVRFLGLHSGGLRKPRSPDGLAYDFHLARNALFHATPALQLHPGDTVLVPAYVCRTAVQPFLARGIRCEYYRVGTDCRPDPEDLQRRLSPAVRALLVVHYFGFPQPVRWLRQLCDERGLRLIEDCAHVLTGSAEGAVLGSSGDASVFSWRKFLPVNDGATLFLNRGAACDAPVLARPGLATDLHAAYNILQAAAAHPESRFCRWLYGSAAAARRILARSPRDAEARGHRGSWRDVPPVGDVHGADFALDRVQLPISRVSAVLVDHSAVARIREARRRNYALLAAGLRRIPGVTLLHEALPEDICPWILPCFMEGAPQALAELRRRGIPAVSWSGVRSPIRPGEYPEAELLYEKLLFLPVHQGMREADIARVLETVAVL